MVRSVCVREWCFAIVLSVAGLSSFVLSTAWMGAGPRGNPVSVRAAQRPIEIVLPATDPLLELTPVRLDQDGSARGRDLAPVRLEASAELLRPAPHEGQWASLKVEGPARHRTESKPGPRPMLASALLGTWYPDREACGAKAPSDFLPMSLTQKQAVAGDAQCRFTSSRQTGRSTAVTAECSDGRAQWTANVTLSLAAGELTWSSEKGVQSYVRCDEPKLARHPVKTAAQRPGHRESKVAVAASEPAIRVIRGAAVPVSWVFVRTR